MSNRTPSIGRCSFFAVAALSAALALSACDATNSLSGGQTKQDIQDSTPGGVTRTKRYVVEVETPKGVVEGHSVIGWRTTCRHGLDGRTCDTSEESEAAAVDLPDGRTLYALLTQHSQVQFVCCYHAYAMKQHPKPTTDYAEFLPDQLPDLVMFDDERDPKSVHVVDGTKPFDKGYRIKRIYLTATDEVPTHKILKRLPWLPSVDGNLGHLLNASIYGPEAGRFGKDSFMEPTHAYPS